MVRTKYQAGALASKKPPQRFNLVRRGFLLGDHVVEAKYHERVCVGEYTFVDRQSLPGLIDPLIHSHGLSGYFADDGSGSS